MKCICQSRFLGSSVARPPSPHFGCAFARRPSRPPTSQQSAQSVQGSARVQRDGIRGDSDLCATAVPVQFVGEIEISTLKKMVELGAD
jgi:hypothetical protein